MLMEGFIDKVTADVAADLYKICESQPHTHTHTQTQTHTHTHTHTHTLYQCRMVFAELIDLKLYDLAFVPCQVRTYSVC